MKQRKVEEHKQELCEILRIENHREQMEKAQAFQKKMGISVPLAIGDAEEQTAHCIISTIRAELQTENMVNTCNAAKWSCVWAAVAATTALITAAAAWLSVWLMLKSA